MLTFPKAARTASLDAGALSPPIAHVSGGVDISLCSSKDDGRVAIPSNLAVDACYDGNMLYVKNRGPLVQYVAVTGSVSAPSRVAGIPTGDAASLLVAYLHKEAAVLPPSYEVAMSVDTGAGSVSISPAATSILDLYGVSRVAFNFIPWKASLYFAAGNMVNALVDEVDAARNCLNGANVFKKVWCSTVFAATASGSVAKFLANAGIDFLEKAPQQIVRGLWGLLQEGMYIGDVAGEVFAPGATSITVSAVSASRPAPGPTPGPTPGPSPTPRPAPPPLTWAEQETPNHPVNTFTNYHNASGMGPAVASGQWVQVSCKVYDPFIQSVNPDGYWYRIASAPWSNAYYSPANTFMNGDPYGGPYTHNTDFAVPNC